MVGRTEIGPLKEAGLDPRDAKGTDKITIDLGTKRDGEEFLYSGDILAVEKLDGSASVKFTGSDDWKDLSRFPIITRLAGFSKFFIKNDAQPGGELVLQKGGQSGISVSGVPSASNILNTHSEQIDPAQRSGWPDLNHNQDTASSGSSEVSLNGGSSLDIPKEAHLLVKALPGNADDIYIGGSGVGTGTGYPLVNGETITLQIDDVAKISFYAQTSGDGVAWIVESE